MHIDRWDRARKETFLEFLQYVQSVAFELYVNGDIFDFPALKGETVWPRHSDIILGLRALSDNGARVTYLIGNHDISLRGIEVHEQNFTVTYRDRKTPMEKNFHGRSFYIEHGHYYDPLFQDHVYEAIDFLKMLTGQAVDVKTVDFVRDMSSLFQRDRKADKHFQGVVDEKPKIGVPERFLKIWDAAAEQLLKRMRYNFVVFGHTHAPGILRMQTPGQYYINTGDWLDNSTYIEYGPDNLVLKDWITSKELDRIDFTESGKTK